MEFSFLETIGAAVELINILNDLASQTARGFVPFSQCNDSNRDEWEDKIVYLDDPSDGIVDITQNDVLADVVVAAEHHDAVTAYSGVLTDICKGHAVACIVAEDEDDPYVSIQIQELDMEIIVENGGWYVIG